MNLTVFAVEAYVLGGGSRIRPEKKKIEKCLPALSAPRHRIRNR